MRMRVGRSRDREGGAALVEFAVLAPLLLLLVLGIIEFGYLFGQFNEIRHAAREGGRYAAVSNPDLDGVSPINDADVVTSVCNALNLPGSTTFDLAIRLVDSDGNTITGAGVLGDTGEVSITANVVSLTSAPIISSFIPSTLSNVTTFRVEQPTAWTSPLTQTGLSC